MVEDQKLWYVWLCPDGETQTQARIDIQQVKLVEVVRTIPVDMQVPKFGRNR